VKFSAAESQVRKRHFSNLRKSEQEQRSSRGTCFGPCGHSSPSQAQPTASLPAPGEDTGARFGAAGKTPRLAVAAIYSQRGSRCTLLQTSERLVFTVIDLYGTDYINSCFLLISTPPASPMMKTRLSRQQLLSNGRTLSSCEVFNWEL